VSIDTPVQRIKVAGEYYVLMLFDEYEALSKAAKALASNFRKPRDVGEHNDAPPISSEGGSMLKTWRRHRGMTQATLAEKVGYKPAHMHLVENGQRRGSPKLWRALAIALNVSVDDILPEN
jgi:DNA-binding XRE family transcriptional regulator